MQRENGYADARPVDADLLPGGGCPAWFHGIPLMPPAPGGRMLRRTLSPKVNKADPIMNGIAR
mgnify:CR=1 FL=1|jgi:hypothetical protein